MSRPECKRETDRQRQGKKMPFYYYLSVRDQNHVPPYEIWGGDQQPASPSASLGGLCGQQNLAPQP